EHRAILARKLKIGHDKVEFVRADVRLGAAGMLSASKTVASHARRISLRNARPSSWSSITRTVSPEKSRIFFTAQERTAPRAARLRESTRLAYHFRRALWCHFPRGWGRWMTQKSGHPSNSRKSQPPAGSEAHD